MKNKIVKLIIRSEKEVASITKRRDMFARQSWDYSYLYGRKEQLLLDIKRLKKILDA
ncbi:MAG: hypothetical protein WC254_07365 [Candidatus Woesearchaeota archaeon]|jgi:hypothetical protein